MLTRLLRGQTSREWGWDLRADTRASSHPLLPTVEYPGAVCGETEEAHFYTARDYTAHTASRDLVTGGRALSILHLYCTLPHLYRTFTASLPQQLHAGLLKLLLSAPLLLKVTQWRTPCCLSSNTILQVSFVPFSPFFHFYRQCTHTQSI